MIYLIVGQPRSGKSQFAVKTAFDIKDENDRIQKKLDEGKELKENELMTLQDGSIVPAIRPVFSDIEEHAKRNDFISEAPKDWREVQDGSVIFYDEVHFRDEYLDQNKYMSQNPMIKELSIHG
ncbi:MAG: zonular occludens toxin domain-containing protein, partial [Carnobacterium sp.]|uniref:zonular occludens toxin domain-containing protein n=1 Tax=Carnobacterium sp. TaxID=48221 RepID=UPI002FC902C7